jgi:DMSO reductase family type II enzyme heme b subunit
VPAATRGLIPVVLAVLMAQFPAARAAPPDGTNLQLLHDHDRLLEVTMRTGLPTAEDDAGWAGIPALNLGLQPQNSINPGLDEGVSIRAQLRAVSDGQRLALRIDWPDTSEDRYSTAHTDRFADAVAVQFDASGEATLPYIGMGEPRRPVQLWFWRAGLTAENLVASGFGTLAPTVGEAPQVGARRVAGGWSVTLIGLLPAAANPLPLAIATWDGAAAGRDGRKHLSPWRLLWLPDRAVDQERLARLAAEARSSGDPVRGARLAIEHGCGACHRLPGGPASALGPDLTRAGGLHWPGYLRRSITAPDVFVVPGSNYRSPAPDLNGAERSLMPSLDLPPAVIDDIVAYLGTLHGDE